MNYDPEERVRSPITNRLKKLKNFSEEELRLLETPEDDEIVEYRTEPLTEEELTEGLNPEQLTAYHALREFVHSYDRFFHLIGGPGCVDGDTEFLSQNGWKKISEYVEGDMVFDGRELAPPLRYIKEPCSDFYIFEGEKHSQMLSLDHMVAYIKDGKLDKIPLINILSNEEFLVPVITDSGIEEVALGKWTKAHFYPSVYKYCFTVASGYLVLRRNGKIFITGNCGKSFTIARFYMSLSEDERERIHFTATTNKAAQELQLAITKNLLAYNVDPEGTSCTTIYKKLGLSLANKKIDDPKKLAALPKWQPPYEKVLIRRQEAVPDVANYNILIIDESSFIDYNLLRYLENDIQEYQLKVIFVGDKNQLTPVGLDHTPIYEGRYSKYPTYALTQPMRQHPESEILRYCNTLKDVIEGTKENFTELTYSDEIVYLKQKEFEKKVEEVEADKKSYRVVAQTNAKVGQYNKIFKNTLSNGNVFLEAGDLAIVNTATSAFHTDAQVLVINTLPKREHIKASSDIPRLNKDFGMVDGRWVVVSDGVKGGAYFVPDKLSKTKEILPYIGLANMTISVADIRHIYSCTTHKAQGSTVDVIFLDLNTFNASMDKIELARLLYVAFSRAREKVYVTGYYRGINA